MNIISFCGKNKSRDKTISTIYKTLKNVEINSVPTDMYTQDFFMFKIKGGALAKFMAFKSLY